MKKLLLSKKQQNFLEVSMKDNKNEKFKVTVNQTDYTLVNQNFLKDLFETVELLREQLVTTRVRNQQLSNQLHPEVETFENGED